MKNFQIKTKIFLTQNPWVIFLFSIFYILSLRGGVILCYGWDAPFEQAAADQHWQDRPRYFPETVDDFIIKEKYKIIKKYNDILAKDAKVTFLTRIYTYIFHDKNRAQRDLALDHWYALHKERDIKDNLWYRYAYADVKEQLWPHITQLLMLTQKRINTAYDEKDVELLKTMECFFIRNKPAVFCNYIIHDILLKQRSPSMYDFAASRPKYLNMRELVINTLTNPKLLSLWIGENNVNHDKKVFAQEIFDTFGKHIQKYSPDDISFDDREKYELLLDVRINIALILFADQHGENLIDALYNRNLYAKEYKIQRFLYCNPHSARLDYFRNHIYHG